MSTILHTEELVCLESYQQMLQLGGYVKESIFVGDANTTSSLPSMCTIYLHLDCA